MAFPSNWFNVATDHLGTSEFYLRPAFRQRYFRWSFITLMLICVFVVGVAAKFWTRISIFAIAWLAVGLVFAFRVVLRSHECLHLFLTSGAIHMPDKGSPMEIVLGVAADVSNWALSLAYSSIIAILLAMLAILASH